MPHVSSQRKDGVLIVQLTFEKILDDALTLQVGWELMSLAEQANGKMLLDLEGVRIMSSAMIGKIVALNKKCRADKIELRMCNVPSPFIGVLDKRRLNTFFKIFDSVEEALSDLGRCTDVHGA
jgi:anti-sigma B factor antagonist